MLAASSSTDASSSCWRAAASFSAATILSRRRRPAFGDRHRARLDQRIGANERGVGFLGPRGSGGEIVVQAVDAGVELANAAGGELLRLLRQVVEAGLRQIEPARERRPLVLEIAELPAQIVEPASGRPCRRRPASTGAPFAADHALKSRGAAATTPSIGERIVTIARIDDRLDAGGDQQRLQRHPAEHHDQRQAEGHFDQPVAEGARQQARTRRLPAIGDSLGRRRFGLLRRLFVEGLGEARSQAARIEPRRPACDGFARRPAGGFGRRQTPRIFGPFVWLRGANKNGGFAGLRICHGEPKRMEV